MPMATESMSELFIAALTDADSLDDVKRGVIGVLNEVGNGSRLGYVSGIITSDTPELVDLNMRRLAEYTDYLRSDVAFPVFSSTDIFSNELEDKLSCNTIGEWHSFWRDVLEQGHVTDIFMTPRWRSSAGAKDEHETAKRIGISIHYMEDNPGLRSIMDRHKK
ncbi:DUF4406 domain-containing protein [Candidatus Marsarchaeota archaeon]|nr:DUF4406 domain-containing protein [Candidatus Marsarchaeota archaeon]